MINSQIDKIEKLILKSHYQQANRIIDTLISEGFIDARLFYQKALVTSYLEKKETGLFWLEKALEIDSNHCGYLFTLSRWLLDCYQFDKAINSLTKLIAINDDYFIQTAYFFRAVAFYQKKQNDKCLSDLAMIDNKFELWVMGKIYSKQDMISVLS